MKLIHKFYGVIAALVGIFLFGKYHQAKGKQKAMSDINEAKVKNNEKLGKVRRDTSKLSDDELDSKLSKIYSNK